jgi:Mg-chelatase subunit ChlD
MVQVYWDRRQRGARTTEHDDCRRMPHQGKVPLLDTRVVRVCVSVAAHTHTSVTLVVLVDGKANGAGPCSPPAEGSRSW